MIKNKKTNKPAVTDAEKAEVIKENFPNGFETQEVRITASPYHKKGDVVVMGKAPAQKIIRRGWAEAVTVLLLFALPFTVSAQSLTFYNKDYVTSASDTAVNTGVAVLQCAPISGGGTTTTIVARVLEISGTTGGTITLQGCVKCDGTDWKAMVQPNSTTALGTHTATDVADNNYHWWLTGSPYRQYRISYAGTGTMSARIFGWLVKK